MKLLCTIITCVAVILAGCGGVHAAAADLYDDIQIENINFTTCYTDPNKFGWENYRNYTGGKRKIWVEQGAWESARVSSRILQILLVDVLGYRLQYSEFLGADAKQIARLKANAMDIILEMWAPPEPYWYDFGSMGYSGRTGFYIPNWLIEENPSFGYDFWRFLINPDARNIFFQRHWKVAVPKPEGQFVCTDIVNGCNEGYYAPKGWTKELDANYIQFVGSFAEWGTYIPERLIDGLKLNATITYLGADLESFVSSAMANKSAIIFNYCRFYPHELSLTIKGKPSIFISNLNVSRIMFPEDSRGYFAAFQAAPEKTPLLCDEPMKTLSKGGSFAFMADFPELSPLMSRFKIREDQLNDMLRDFSAKNYSDVACDWVLNNVDAWKSWIPAPPKTYDSCPVGTGRYISEGLSVCLKCPAKTFSWTTDNTGECMPCNNNGVCPGGAVVNAKSGYWMPEPPDLNSSNIAQPEFYNCPYPSTCCPAGNCTFAEICADGFSGPLCTECAKPNHFLWNYKCMDCSKPQASLPLIVVGSLLGTVAFIFVPKADIPAVELLFFYFQVINLIFAHNLKLYFNSPRLGTFLALLALDIDGLVNDCPAPMKGLQKQIFRFLLPALFPIWLGILFGFGKAMKTSPALVQLLTRFTPWYMKGQKLEVIFFRSFKSMLTLVLMPLVEASLNVLDCRDLMRRIVVYRAPEIECFRGSHVGPAAFSIIVLLALLFVLPLSEVIVLGVMKRRGEVDYSEQENPDLIAEMKKALYEQFKPQFFYMEPILVWEKGIIVVVFSILGYKDSNNYNVYLLLFAITCALRLYIQPHREKLEAYLDREMTVGWIVILAYRISSFQASPNSVIPYVIAMMFLPVLFHSVRWLYHAYYTHKDVVEDLARGNSVALKKKFGGSMRSIAEAKPLDPDGKDKPTGDGPRIMKQESYYE
ncbi:hypothetical protein HDU96_008956 [Phlyctochytrium bullatum]|nr:hypothetical protein HDU96_008956 [Phlyctochytrium bullatum]